MLTGGAGNAMVSGSKREIGERSSNSGGVRCIHFHANIQEKGINPISSTQLWAKYLGTLQTWLVTCLNSKSHVVQN